MTTRRTTHCWGNFPGHRGLPFCSCCRRRGKPSGGRLGLPRCSFGWKQCRIVFGYVGYLVISFLPSPTAIRSRREPLPPTWPASPVEKRAEVCMRDPLGLVPSTSASSSVIPSEEASLRSPSLRPSRLAHPCTRRNPLSWSPPR